ncbi:hypothetical protein DPSP01_002792 [Paraphaeosphaeria sporulosa]|uniref:CBM1 domain-containing protein n=1 Tax=Paraphaeosphaeria sporulosa TaxID=1460663 RepID=A0A177CHP9_9PLEO|nr:uncharacterized protein CC84DRAFT_763662 [Paraphaeosphaeria sporulosa]OAG06398.1 hypothetical protein CC84DRAFT_763662 [Paraphaeosphaeria sporulosa]
MRFFTLAASLISLTLAQHYHHPSITCSPSPTTPSIEPPRYTIPCTMSDDSPCPSGWFCTPTTIPPTATTDPWGGVCKDNPTPPPVTPCVMGNDTPCLPSSRCTPTTIPPANPTDPWGGQCIAGPPTSTSEWDTEYTQTFTPITPSVYTPYTSPVKSYDSPVPTWTGRPCRFEWQCRRGRGEKCVRGRCVLW